MNYEQGLANQAEAAEQVQKPTRAKPPKLYPQWNPDGTRALDAEGKEAWGTEKMTRPKPPKEPKAAKAPKVPKEPEYQKDDNGEFVLDEAGEKIPVVKVRAAPIRRVPSGEAGIITIDDEQAKKLAGYKGARAQYAKPLRDGQTIGDYLADGGDRGFLRFYVKDGGCSITTPAANAV